MTRTVDATPTVHVDIRYSPGDTIAHDFVEWQSEARVFPIRGTGASSPPVRLSQDGPLHDGQWVGVFDAADWPAVKAWLDARDRPAV